MRKTLLTLTPAALLLLVASGATQAADTATLSVIGTIAPAACTPSFSNGGVVNYGNIASDSLNESTNTTLADQPITFSVNCSAPTKIGFALTDNREGTKATTFINAFGLNVDSAGNKIGFFSALTTGGGLAQVDGNPAYLKESRGFEYRDVSSLYNSLTPTGTQYSHAWGPSGSVSLEDLPFITTASVDLNIRTYIAAKNTLELSDDINLDGNVTFTLVYL